MSSRYIYSYFEKNEITTLDSLLGSLEFCKFLNWIFLNFMFVLETRSFKKKIESRCSRFLRVPEWFWNSRIFIKLFVYWSSRFINFWMTLLFSEFLINSTLRTFKRENKIVTVLDIPLGIRSFKFWTRSWVIFIKNNLSRQNFENLSLETTSKYLYILMT